MNDDYLWTGEGRPDPEVERLERVLSPLAHRAAPLALPAVVALAAPRRHRLAWTMAAAAALLVAAAIPMWLARGTWEVAALSGAPRLGDRSLGPSRRAARGTWLETDAASSARVTVGRLGIVDVGPGSRLQLVDRRGPEHRFALERGWIQAWITAPPRRFVVETPYATAVDLGCAYTLEVDAAGGGWLTVNAGWVSFERRGLESFVPAGARCATRPGRGPGVPYFTDAAPAFKNALARLEVGGDSVRAPALEALCAAARREDAFTLWHLLPRLQGADRARAHDRLQSLVPAPAGVSREGVLAGDRAMLDRWWSELGFGDIADWRRWRGAPAGGSGPG